MTVFKAILQDVIADTGNSSVANLNAGATFTGVVKTTLGVAGIQVSIKTDQNCTIYVDQSPDNSNWDIVDTITYYYSLGGQSWTIQAVNSYVRVRVTNNGASATTYLRLQTALCPIVEALPRALDEGRLKTVSALKDAYGFESENTPTGEMRSVTPVKLAGANFIGTTVDTNFWTVTNTNNGTTTQTGGQMILQTNVTSQNGATAVTSLRRGRYSAGSSMRYRAVIQVGDTGVANNKRRWGIADWATLPTITDGAYFQLNGTTFGVATMKGGAETLVTSGSFNGTLGSVYILDTNVKTFEIYWTNSKVWFVVGDRILHTVSATTTTWANTVTQYIWMDNVNSGNIQTNQILYCRVASIARLGALVNAPNRKYITTNTTTVCKYGAGTLHKIMVNSPTEHTITLYDAVSAVAGTVFAIITPGGGLTPFELDYELDFYTGLTVTTVGSPNLTVIFE
jgi:hypothetical protein